MSVTVEHKMGLMNSSLIRFGLGYGAVAAMILSYTANKSILWMLIDGWLSWVYVIFFALFRA
ncbi:MAG: hypothetical protein M3N08_01925 [Pseudomonadota bacterium]|nr:hypothetical protein [Pseudomonadota bacterium]